MGTTYKLWRFEITLNFRTRVVHEALQQWLHHDGLRPLSLYAVTTAGDAYLAGYAHETYMPWLGSLPHASRLFDYGPRNQAYVTAFADLVDPGKRARHHRSQLSPQETLFDWVTLVGPPYLQPQDMPQFAVWLHLHPRANLYLTSAPHIDLPATQPVQPLAFHNYHPFRYIFTMGTFSGMYPLLTIALDATASTTIKLTMGSNLWWADIPPGAEHHTTHSNLHRLFRIAHSFVLAAEGRFTHATTSLSHVDRAAVPALRAAFGPLGEVLVRDDD